VLFEYGDVVAVAGEEVAEHHSGGTPAYDAAASLYGFVGGRSHSGARVAIVRRCVKRE
jgi:hypothetical protein